MRDEFPAQGAEFTRESLIARLRQANTLAHSLSQPLTSALLTAQFVREATEQIATASTDTSLETLKNDAVTLEQNMLQLKNLLEELRVIVRLPPDII